VIIAIAGMYRKSKNVILIKSNNIGMFNIRKILNLRPENFTIKFTSIKNNAPEYMPRHLKQSKAQLPELQITL
jgi:hypothetical protein